MRGRIYPSGSYQISGSDLSPEMVEIAERNAERAGVGGDIKFSVENFVNFRHCQERSNPGT
jgi:23S rRNA G2445 N2-methylase RlmL